MSCFLFLLHLIFWTHSSIAHNVKDLCREASALEPSLKKGDIHVVKNSKEAYQQFKKIYTDPRRLESRIFWSEDDQSYAFIRQNKKNLLPLIFVKNLKRHLQQALQSSFAKFIYYADLGHAHLFIPEEQFWDPAQPLVLFKSPQTLSLFHTGELYQFKKNGSLSGALVEDPQWQRQYRYRNFVGINQPDASIQSIFAAPNEAYNTVRHILGYREVGTLLISAHQFGCFDLEIDPLNLRFDLSIGL